jgi:hypothetical protein
MNKATPTGWTKRYDGAWETMIDGTTYLIDRDGDMYYAYRSLGWEQVDAASSLIEAMVKAERY